MAKAGLLKKFIRLRGKQFWFNITLKQLDRTIVTNGMAVQVYQADTA